MLVEFRVANFRSFDEEQVLSMQEGASKDDSHPGNLIRCKGFNLLKPAAIYGPNASGKSNLIKGLKFMSWLVRESATKLNQGDEIPLVMPFRLSAESSARPSTFHLTGVLSDTIYEYGFSVTRERVHEESLTVRPPDSKKQRWLERRWDPDAQGYRWAVRGPLQSDRWLLQERTRDNGLALSRGAELNLKPLTELFLWFRTHFWVFDLSELPVALFMGTAGRIQKDPGLRDRVLRMLRHADLGIDGLDVEETPQASEQLPGSVRAFLTRGGAKILSSSEVTVHTKPRVPGSDHFEGFEMGEEANGTQRLFALAGPFLEALDRGALVVVDELECSMHPLLSRKLVELFQGQVANTTGAQLVFATHDSTLMDPELLRRDQIWLVEKSQAVASRLFSLYDFETKNRPRSTEAFQKNYLAGRYGAVPRFGPAFEDLEHR